MRVRSLVVAILLVGGTLVLVLRKQDRVASELSRDTENQSKITNAPAVVIALAQPSAPEKTGSPLEKKIEELRLQSLEDFNKLLNRLRPYGKLQSTRDIYIQRRTNNAGGIKVEVEVRSENHKATFVAGPLNANGLHVNPFLQDGNLLTLFECLYDGSDTRRKPEAANEWYLSSGQWSKEEAVAESLRLAQAIGHQTNRVARHEVVAVPLTLKDPAGATVKATPFYKVDLYTDDDSRLLGVEYRMGKEPPGKVTRWFNWPPIKVR